MHSNVQTDITKIWPITDSAWCFELCHQHFIFGVKFLASFKHGRLNMRASRERCLKKGTVGSLITRHPWNLIRWLLRSPHHLLKTQSWANTIFFMHNGHVVALNILDPGWWISPDPNSQPPTLEAVAVPPTELYCNPTWLFNVLQDNLHWVQSTPYPPVGYIYIYNNILDYTRLSTFTFNISHHNFSTCASLLKYLEF